MMIRFVGAFGDFAGRRLDRLGDRVDVIPEDFEEAVSGGCALLPDEEFEAIGFTAQELTRYATAGDRARGMEPGFAAKMEKAQNAFRAWYYELNGITPAQPVAADDPGGE